MARGSGFVFFLGRPSHSSEVTQDDLYDDRTMYCSEAGLVRCFDEVAGH